MTNHNYIEQEPSTTARAPKFPPMVVVSVCNTCNYLCQHCLYPAYVKNREYTPKIMDDEVFKKIANEMAKHPESVLRLIAWGEPLMHPRLTEFVEYMHKVAPNNKITLITNGFFLTSEKSLALMQAGLNLVEVSIDAAKPETYQIRRCNSIASSFQRVEANLNAMRKLRQKYGLKTKIATSFIVWPNEESQAEFVEFEKKWKSCIDDVIRRPLHTFCGSVPSENPLPAVRPPCYALWARCAINPWGEIAVCYNDWHRTDICGKITEGTDSIESVWNGSILQGRRTGQKSGKFFGICTNCKDYNPMAWQNPYEKVIERCFKNTEPFITP